MRVKARYLLGASARRALAPGSRWRVLALFRLSIYCQSDASDVVCLGVTAIGAGPLNAICELADDFEWDTSGLAVGDRVSVDAQALRIADLFELSPAAPAGLRRAGLMAWKRGRGEGARGRGGR